MMDNNLKKEKFKMADVKKILSMCDHTLLGVTSTWEEIQTLSLNVLHLKALKDHFIPPVKRTGTISKEQQSLAVHLHAGRHSH